MQFSGHFGYGNHMRALSPVFRALSIQHGHGVLKRAHEDAATSHASNAALDCALRAFAKTPNMAGSVARASVSGIATAAPRGAAGQI